MKIFAGNACRLYGGELRARVARRRPWDAMWSSSAPGSPGCTRCTACASMGLQRGRARGGRRRRRHLVLEPLPGRALRRREHRLLLLVLRGAPAGVGVDRALPGPAGDPALPRATSPTASTCGRDIQLRHAGRRRRPSTTRRAAGRSAPRRARPSRAQFVHHGDGLPVGGAGAGDPGPGALRGRVVPHRPLAARGRRLHRQAGRRDRHRLDRHPVDPGDRAATRRTLYVFQRTANFSVPARNAPLDPEVERSWKDRYAQQRETQRRSMLGVAIPPGRAVGAGGLRGGAAAHATRSAGSRAAACRSSLSFTRPPRRRARERHGGRVRPGEDPRDRRATRRSRRCSSRATSRIGASASAVDTGYFETFNRDNVTLVDVRAAPIEEITPTGLRTARRRVRARHRSSSPPASTR